MCSMRVVFFVLYFLCYIKLSFFNFLFSDFLKLQAKWVSLDASIFLGWVHPAIKP